MRLRVARKIMRLCYTPRWSTFRAALHRYRRWAHTNLWRRR